MREGLKKKMEKCSNSHAAFFTLQNFANLFTLRSYYLLQNLPTIYKWQNESGNKTCRVRHESEKISSLEETQS